VGATGRPTVTLRLCFPAGTDHNRELSRSYPPARNKSAPWPKARR
jgi:hypothetical protein